MDILYFLHTPVQVYCKFMPLLSLKWPSFPHSLWVLSVQSCDMENWLTVSGWMMWVTHLSLAQISASLSLCQHENCANKVCSLAAFNNCDAAAVCKSWITFEPRWIVCLHSIHRRKLDIFLIHIHKRYFVPRNCVGDNNVLLFYISSSEKINIGCKNTWWVAHRLGKRVVCRQAEEAEPLGGGFGGWSEYPESLPVHSELTRIPATETEKQVLAWPVFLYTGAFCSQARRLRQREGGGGARANVGQWASQCVLWAAASSLHRAYPGESPTRSFLPGIHYTRRRKMFCCYLDIGLWQKI